MTKETKIEVGDWVRFMRNNQLVIGEVRYFPPKASWQTSIPIVTDVGVINEDGVMEVRKP